jgi:Ca2+-transporting ATPase
VLHSVFGTFSLPVVDWVIIVVLAVSVIPVLELAKWMQRRGWFGQLV